MLKLVYSTTMKKIIFASMAFALILTGCSLTKPKTAKQVIGVEEAKAKAADFINKNLMQAGTVVTVKEVLDQGDLYKVVVTMPTGQDINSYLSKDGKTFFPQAMDIAEMEKQKQTDQTAQTGATADKTAAVPAEIKKSDKPAVELFVMSYCPYGTQIEKGIIPVVEALGDKIDFSLKFCDYAMHGEKELNENLAQYCIQKEQPKKLTSYLTCFLKNSNSADCAKQAGVDDAKLKFCVSAADTQYKVTEKNKDKSAWSNGTYPPFDVYKADNEKYGVQGSPTLVINGQQADSGRDSASLLKTICSAFNTQPEECKKALSSTAPSAGFGEGAGSDSGGGCGN